MKHGKEMKTRTLGQDNFQVSALGFGCMGMSFAYGGMEERQAIHTIHQAIDSGITFFDSAEVYGPFDNEKLLAKAIKGRRDQLQIATKFGFLIDPTQQGVNQINGVNSHPDHIRQAVEGSLQRLEIDTIDLLYQHRLDPNVPIEDVIGVMSDLVKEGKVKHLGLCEVSEKTLRKAHAIHPITAIQSEYSLWTRNVETTILPVCNELNIGFVPYSPLGRGFLTGKLDMNQLGNDDFRKGLPRFQEQAAQHNLLLLKQAQKIADEYSSSLAQIALAWMLNKHEHLVPIPGIRKVEHLQDNIQAVNLTLSSETLQQLDDIFAPQAISGERYTEKDLAFLDN